MSRHGIEGSIALALEGRNFVANLREFCDKIEHECGSLQREVMEDSPPSSRARSIGVKRYVLVSFVVLEKLQGPEILFIVSVGSVCIEV